MQGRSHWALHGPDWGACRHSVARLLPLLLVHLLRQQPAGEVKMSTASLLRKCEHVVKIALLTHALASIGKAKQGVPWIGLASPCNACLRNVHANDVTFGRSGRAGWSGAWLTPTAKLWLTRSCHILWVAAHLRPTSAVCSTCIKL